MPTYTFMKRASFTHSAVYFGLLAVWLTPGLPVWEQVFGYGHGLGWIAMVLLSLLALKARTISFSLATLISVGGAIGPFLGSAAFVLLERRGAAGR